MPSEPIDFILNMASEPQGRKVRLIESAETIARRSAKLFGRERSLKEPGIPPTDGDATLAALISELAGQEMITIERPHVSWKRL